MSRTANVRFGRIGERWVADYLQALDPASLALDLSPSAPCDVIWLQPVDRETGTFAVTFVEVKCSRRVSRARNAPLTAAEDAFRALAERSGYRWETWRLHRNGTTCRPVPPYPLSFSPEDMLPVEDE